MTSKDALADVGVVPFTPSEGEERSFEEAVAMLNEAEELVAWLDKEIDRQKAPATCLEVQGDPHGYLAAFHQLRNHLADLWNLKPRHEPKHREQ